MSHQTLKDISTVISVNAAGWITSLTLSDVHLLFGIAAMATATGYTAWKWIRDLRRKK